MKKLEENIRNLLVEYSEENILACIQKLRTQPVTSTNASKFIFQHRCADNASYHKGKYKHWVKIVTGIDPTKNNGYAFIGKFISTFQEHEISDGTYILEYVGCSSNPYKFCKIKNNQFEELVEGNYKNFVTFRRECQEVMAI